MQDNSIDLVEIVKIIWSSRKLIFKTVIIFFLIGCVVALTSAEIYEAETTFVPQTSDQNSSSSKGLGSLASLAGINLNAEAASSLDNYISPLLYSKIIESDEFSLNLMKQKLIFIDGRKLSIKDYLLSGESNSLNPVNIIYKIFSFIQKYTIGLITKKNKNKAISSEIIKEYNFISDEDFSLVRVFREKFSIEANEKQGYIKVKAYDKDPFISAQLVELITKNLQSSIISLRTNKIKEQLDYSMVQYNQKQVEFEILQNKLAEFRDSNKNISTAVFLSELQKLESEYQLQNNILISLASEYNNNKIKLNKDTPIFSVLDEVSIPNIRSKPQRKNIVLFYIVLGVICSIGYVLSIERLKEIIDKIKTN